MRIGLRVGTPKAQAANGTWGDNFLAVGIHLRLAQLGVDARIIYQDEDWHPLPSEVIVDFLGLLSEPAWTRSDAIAWVISHPERFDASFLRGYGRLFSSSLCWLPPGIGEAPQYLPQPTDLNDLAPMSVTDAHAYRDSFVFVGNSRRVKRPVVHLIAKSGYPLILFGADWDDYASYGNVKVLAPLDRRRVKWLYANSGLVLNDHWPSMTLNGFLSNRVADVLAVRGLLVSDTPRHIDERLLGRYVDVANVRSVSELYEDRERIRGEILNNWQLPSDFTTDHAAVLIKGAAEVVRQTARWP